MKAAGRTPELQALLARGWFSAQPESFRSALLRRATQVAFMRGEAVFHADDGPGGVYGVTEGSFGVYAATRDAGPTLGHVLHPGDWFGHGPLFRGGRRVLSFKALAPSTALLVPLAALGEMIETNPVAARSVGALGNADVDAAVAAVADLLIRRPDRRIAAVLLRAAGMSAAAAPVAADLALSQADLGEMANVSRHLANRTLSEFEARCWVARRYGGVTMLDPGALAAFAAGGS